MNKMTEKSRLRKTTGVRVGRKNQPPSKATANTKKARLINLLSTKSGSDITSISKKFGWLPHTTRAALTRLRQAGYEISSEKTGKRKVSKYRITCAPMEQNA